MRLLNRGDGMNRVTSLTIESYSFGCWNIALSRFFQLYRGGPQNDTLSRIICLLDTLFYDWNTESIQQRIKVWITLVSAIYQLYYGDKDNTNDLRLVTEKNTLSHKTKLSTPRHMTPTAVIANT